jgi:hypothetical protein
MSRQSHEEFLKRSVRQTLIRERERRDKAHWSVDEVRQLKIQTVEPWKRVVYGFLGLTTAMGGVLTLSEKNRAIGIVMLVVSLMLMFVAAFGIKKSVEAVFNAIDLADLVSGIVDVFDL